MTIFLLTLSLEPLTGSCVGGVPPSVVRYGDPMVAWQLTATGSVYNVVMTQRF